MGNLKEVDYKLWKSITKEDLYKEEGIVGS